jgi:hypothetical protein
MPCLVLSPASNSWSSPLKPGPGATVGVVKTRATLTAGHGPRLYAITLRRIHLHRQALRRQARLKPPSRQEAFHLAREARTRRQDDSEAPCRGCPRGPDKAPAEDTHEAPARLLPRALVRPRQDSCRGRSQGPGKNLAGNTSKTAARLCRPVADPAQRPTHQLSKYPRGSAWLLGQLVKHLRGGMRIFVKTLSPHQHSSQPASLALHASSAWTRVEARRGGDGRDELCCHPR